MTNNGTHIQDVASIPIFRDIPEPRMVCLTVGNGAASKPLQSYLDGHPELYMIPAYPLMYFYPHWHEWLEAHGELTWPLLVDLICKHHPSILDSRVMPGHNGLTNLGQSQDQSLAIDAAVFKAVLMKIVADEPVSSRTFLLAIHYAYAICQNEDIAVKKVLLFHVHVSQYIGKYCLGDFPDMLAIFMVRDPRSNIFGRLKHSFSAVNFEKMNLTDAIIYSRRDYMITAKFLYEGLEDGFLLLPENCAAVKAEDLYFRRDEVIRAVADFIGVRDDPCLEMLTFGGLTWWGDSIYNMKPMNQVNPRMVQDDWKQRLATHDWYVMEGLLRHYFNVYGYEMEKFRAGSFLHLVGLYLAMLLPSSFEVQIIAAYLNPRTFLKYMRAAISEGTASVPLKSYAGNAFYQHKWTNEGLNLHKIRWYRRLLERGSAGVPRRSIYVLANAGRYIVNIGYIAAAWGARIRICHRAYVRALDDPREYPTRL